MTKDEVLNYAAPNPAAQSDAVAMAYQHLTAEAIQAKTARLETDIARATVQASRWFKTLLLWGGLTAVAILLMFMEQEVATLVTMGIALALVIVATKMLERLGRQQRCIEAVLESFQPIAGTDACQEALAYLEGDAPGVATWRDIALAERGQLYSFDVDIMRRLHTREQYRLRAKAEPIEALERQRLNDEACRKVHGLMPLATAG